MNFETCSHCGEFRDAANHDSARCWTIARAFAMERANMGDETSHHIAELRTWLSTHTPRETWTPGQYRAYDDRLRALAGWLAKSQLLERTDR